jgi:hypothetical protein
MKIVGSFLAVVALALPAPVALAARTHHELTIVIRHQYRGCHTWGVEGGRFAARLTIHLDGDTPVLIANRDVMPHRLIQLSGPKVALTGSPYMNGPWSAVELRFPKHGVYRFTTRAGEDYMAGVKTLGKDNVLRLNVVVS